MDRNKFKSMLIPNHEGCLEWTGYTMPKPGHPYGRLKFNGSKQLAHRVAYMIEFGEIPEGMCVIHRCDNPRCCNPDHLSVGTQVENIKDRDAKGRCNARFPHKKGSETLAAKLVEDDVIKIRELRLMGMTTVALSKMYGICTSGISRICSKQIWKHI